MKLSDMPKSEPKQESAKTKNINEAYEELKDCSSDQLMQRLAKEIQSQKQSGAFDYDSIKASIDKIKMYLTNETYENMIRIIDSFK